jgi:hypothetical protein
MKQLELFHRVIYGQQGAGMSHIYLFILKGNLNLSRQLEQTNVVGDGGTVLS